MSIRLAEVLEGRQVLEGDKEIQDFLYSKEFIAAVKNVMKKLSGGWGFDVDQNSGTFEWSKKGVNFYATPNWDGATNTPVNVMDSEGDDMGSETINFSIDLKKSPEENAAAYVARVVVPVINKIEAGKYESAAGPVKLAAVLEDMTPEIGDKMKRPDLGKYGQRKQGKKKRKNGPVALKNLLEDMTDDPPEMDVPGPMRTFAPTFTKKQEKGKGRAAVRGLRDAIRRAEEDMTPEIGKKMKRPDLGKYGGKKVEAVKAGPHKLNQILQAETDVDLDTADQDSQAPGPMRREMPAVRKNVKPVSRLSMLVGEGVSEEVGGEKPGMEGAIKSLAKMIDDGNYWEDVMDKVAKQFGVDSDKLRDEFEKKMGVDVSAYMQEKRSAKLGGKLAACVARAEEDMTPEIGRKTKRNDLGAVGKDPKEYVPKAKGEGKKLIGAVAKAEDSLKKSKDVFKGKDGKALHGQEEKAEGIRQPVLPE